MVRTAHGAGATLGTCGEESMPPDPTSPPVAPLSAKEEARYREAWKRDAHTGAVVLDRLLATLDAARAQCGEAETRAETAWAYLHGMQDGAVLRDTLALVDQLRAQLAEARGEAAGQRQNATLLAAKLSDILAKGNASTWEHIIHAAEVMADERDTLARQLAEANAHWKRDVDDLEQQLAVRAAEVVRLRTALEGMLRSSNVLHGWDCPSHAGSADYDASRCVLTKCPPARARAALTPDPGAEEGKE